MNNKSVTNIAIETLLESRPGLLCFLFYKDHLRLQAPADKIISESGGLSSGEQILITIALDLWCASGKTNIYDILTTLDDRNFMNFIKAMLIMRGIPLEKINFNSLVNEAELFI